MITIICENCSKRINIPKERLKAYEGKAVVIPCPQCGFSIKYQIAKTESMPSPLIDPPTQITGAAFTRTRAMLEVVADDKASKQMFDLSGGKNIIGRYSSAPGQQKVNISIHTTDQNMSRIHCSVEMIASKGSNPILLLADAGSKNGTYLGSRKLGENESLHLTHGDTIRIGSTTLVFYLDS